MDEAGIPMLVSRYMKNNCEPRKEGPVEYIGTAVYIISVRGDTNLEHTAELTMSERNN